MVNAYDEVPYASHAFLPTSIEHLFTVGRLLGQNPADPRECSVLEVGCASGGNLFPLAANFPGSTFLGIDLSRGQIESAQQVQQQWGLTNIAFRAEAVENLRPEDGQFDYVIVHGIYSWVEEPVRRHILRCCRENLSPNGVAFVSFNTRPGWNAVGSLRDLLLFHLEPIKDRKDRTREARSLLKFMRRAMDSVDSAYGRFVREECDLVLRLSPNYLAHDHLEDINEPCYLSDFVGMAHRAGLRYLGDAHLPSMYIGNLATEVLEVLHQCDNLLLREQYLDYFNNRRFRCALLAHSKDVAPVDLDAIDVRDHYLWTELTPEPEQDRQSEQSEFRCGSLTFSAKTPWTKAALWMLSELDGARLHYQALEKECATRCGQPHDDASRLDLHDMVRRLVLSHVIQISRLPARYESQLTARPCIWWLAREEALQRQYVTSMHHEPVELTQPMRILFQLLDGTRTLEDIEDAVMQLVHDGDVELPGQEETETPQSLVDLVQNWVASCLEIFRLKGFYPLEP